MSTRNRFASVFWIFIAAAIVAPHSIVAEEPKATHAAIDPQPKKDEGWQKRHATINENVKKTPDSQLIFIGDSITAGWGNAGKEAWAKHYAPRKAVNLGIGGDRTQHVLWRLDNGNLEGVKPKAAVIMIGTNNSGSDSAAHIADGITAIVKKLRTKLPDTKILLLGVFPRGEKTNAQREKLVEVNKTVAKLDDGKSVHYLDISQNLMNPDGMIMKEVMPDFLHLSPKGYDIWANSIEAKLKELLGEK